MKKKIVLKARQTRGHTGPATKRKKVNLQSPLALILVCTAVLCLVIIPTTLSSKSSLDVASEVLVESTERAYVPLTSATKGWRDDTLTGKTEHFKVPSWMASHVQFQNEWMISESTSRHSRLPQYSVSTNETRPPLLIWTCQGKGFCGGLGDRIYGIIMGLYIAMLTQRIYLVQEWKGPDAPRPLSAYLQPNHLHWRAMVSPDVLDKMGILSTIDNREHPLLLEPGTINNDKRDYYLRNNIMTYESLLVQSTCLQDYWNQQGGRNDSRPLSNVGFFTLFQFTERVDALALSLLRSSKVIDESMEKKEISATKKFLALHIRTGQGKTWDDPERHSGIQNLQRFDECAVRLQEAVQKRCGWSPDVYIASDNDEAKDFFLTRHRKDGSFKAAMNLEVFHIDRTKTGMLTDVATAYDQVWGELKVLIDAQCLVMSRSKFSTLAMELSPQQPRCAVYFDDCNSEKVNEAVQALSC